MPEQHDDLAKARSYLERAESLLDACAGRAIAATELAVAAATIGTGYAVLATIPAPISSVIRIVPGDAVARREAQAREEARPHDDETIARNFAQGPCEFVLNGKRCIDLRGHALGHRLEDGTRVEADRG